MAQPPQYERDPDVTRALTAVKVAVKHLNPEHRAMLLAWLLLYYKDDGLMFSQQISQRRKRIALDGVDYWLAKV